MKIDWQAAMSGKRPLHGVDGDQWRVLCSSGEGPYKFILEDNCKSAANVDFAAVATPVTTRIEIRNGNAVVTVSGKSE